ncbi:MAG: DUF1501 domain-containing protein [Verrucomicrobiota bacterium]|nr:DUF1501 domain-containing protein [Verrucomicrobiota bacterium]
MNPSLNSIDELGRREFIANAAKACLGVGLMPMAGSYIHNSVKALTPGARPATARHVIYLNMAGAMSHLDTFGPQVNNPEIMGDVTTIPTSADGVLLSQNLPLTAKHMHNAAIIKTMVTSQGAHEQASYLMHTSYLKRGTIVHPTFGSWVSKLSGPINRSIPRNVKIGGGRGSAGFLEAEHGALPIGNPKEGLANSTMADYLDHEKFGSRISMAEKMNVNFTAQYNQKQVRAYSKLYQDAVKLMNSEDLNAFDITQEPESMHELYGTTNFGQGCLLARRLIENKVRYVEVSRGGWDTHDNNFEAVANNCADIDKALSALLTDLEMRGLLKETLVVLTSEFGRTPKINSRDGRDHWPYCFTAFMAGGGVKGGTTYGEVDKIGRSPIAGKPIKPEDLNASIAYLLGLPLKDVQYSPSGRPFTIAHNGEPLFDVIA